MIIKRKKAFWWLILLFVVIGVFTAAVIIEENKYDYDIMDVLSGAMIGKTIIIDAGHGGFDPGAIGLNGTREKDVNLAVSRRVADYLRQSGAVVIETRTEDKALGDTKKADMAKRVEIATENNGEVFISIQANFLPQHQYSGAQTFYGKNNSEAKALAESIQQAVIDNVGNTDRVAMSIDSIYLVKSLDIPCIIVEVGFLSNQAEEALLNDDEYRNRMAYGIYAGIVKYFNGTETDSEVDGVTEDNPLNGY